MSQINGRSKLLLGRLILVFLIATFAVLGFAQFGGLGAGTEDDPYQVANATHLDQVRNFLGNPDVYFVQTADIDIGGVANWVPIGTADNDNDSFRGKYDGRGFEVQRMTRSSSFNRFGLFGFTRSGAELRNIHVANQNNPYGNGVSASLVAYARDTIIENCSATGRRRYINATQGGLVGQTIGSTSIHRCMVDLIMVDQGSGGRAGGIVGVHGATGAISESFALIDMTSRGSNNPAASGLVGNLTNGSVRDCYAIGIIRSDAASGTYGALVGGNSNRPISNSYAIVSYDVAGGTTSGLVLSGAVAQVTESYWNREMTGITTSPGGGASKNTSEMLRQDTYVRWDFVEEPIWNMAEGVSFPFLAWEGDEPGEHVIPPAELPPSNLQAELGDLIVDLTWAVPSVREPLGYNIYRDGRRINTELVEEEEYRDENVVEYVRYTYHVTAVYEGDPENRESEPSNEVVVVFQSYEGAGTAANPYLIEDAVQLNGMRYFLSSHFRLAEDIDLGVAPWNQGEGWEPIGDNDFRFTGSLDGNNHTISNLTINRRSAYQGLFGYTQGQTIRNLNLEDVDLVVQNNSGGLSGYTSSTNITNVHITGRVETNSSTVGGMVGYGMNGTITNCSFTGTVINTSTSSQTGGLFGACYLTINDCWTDAEIITGGTYAGGLVGSAASTLRINRSFALGDVTSSSTSGDLYIGGLMGRATMTYLEDSYALGNVTSTADGGRDRVGGLIGSVTGTSYNITRCFAAGAVTGRRYIGGLVGAHWSTNASAANTHVEDCYAAGSVTGTDDVGGLIGFMNNKEVYRSYSSGGVTGTTNVGGLIGRRAAATTNNSYWNTQTSGQANSPGGGTGITTAQMSQQDTFEGWDFEDVWSVTAGVSFPWLQRQGEAWPHNIPGPFNLAAEEGEEDLTIDLTWEMAGDPDFFKIYRNGEVIDTTEETFYNDDNDIETGIMYSYQVTAVFVEDEEERETAFSNTATFRFPPRFAGGDGTAENPYLVQNSGSLLMVQDNRTAHFRQTAHIDISDMVWLTIGRANNDADAFTGSYDGDGFEIRGLRTNNSFYMGLFGYTRNATLRNIHIRNMNLLGSHISGGLAAETWNTTIEDCSVVGNFTHSTNFYFGGLVGQTTGTTSITRCWTDVNMNGTGRIYIGGLVGSHGASGNIIESFAIGNVANNNTNANLEMGGLVGRITNGQIINCYATGNVTSQQNNNMVGGLVGSTSRNIINSYSTGAVVSAGDEVGGLIGRRTGGAQTTSYWNTESSGLGESAGGTGLDTIEMLDIDSYEGWDFGDEEERGIWSKDDNSYPYLSYEGDEAPEHVIPSPIMPPSNVQAEVGEDRDRLIITWDEPSLGEPVGYHVYRNGVRINPQMIEELEFTDTNVELWTWYNYQVSAVYEVDGELVESTRSGVLRAMIDDFAGGTGTADDPYLIENRPQLEGMRFTLNAHYRLEADIDLSEAAWSPIGNSSTDRFVGTLNGNGHVISGLNINTGSSYQGLFGYTGSTGTTTLNNVILEDVNIQGGSYIGALVGRADGTTNITNCHSSGTIRGASYVGGLTGYYSGTMNRGSSSATIIGTGSQVGGIIGDSWGTLWDCHATGNVTGLDLVGGLAGYDTNGSVNRSFATGNVEGRNQVGGLLGRNRTSSQNDCYALGNVTGTGSVGGLIGTRTEWGQIHRCYSIGRVTGENNVGGLVGILEAGNPGLTASYWNERTSGQQQSAGGEARDERHMQYPYTPDTFVGWNFNTVWQPDEEGLNSGGYPYHRWYTIIPTDIDTPEVTLEMVTIEGVDYARLEWEAVDNANSYIILASSNPDAPLNTWEEIAHIEGTRYDDEVDLEENRAMFYRVIATIEDAPDGRRDSRRRGHEAEGRLNVR